jgi:Uma2 family endonuclease
MSTTTLVTAEQLLRMPDDGHFYELVSGELKKRASPGFLHGVVLSCLSGLLSGHIREHKLGLAAAGRPGFLLARDPDTVLAPDLAFIRRDRLAANPATDAYWPGAPDLAAEVMSPGDTLREGKDKANAWLAAGVRMVWVANPARRTITVYRSAADVKTLTEDGDLDGQDVLPGFRCRVADIFLTD